MTITGQKPLALVTGANGFIGSHLVEALIERGYLVRAFIRTTSNLQWIKGLNIQLAYGSFDDYPSLCDAVDGADYIFHIAAVKSGDRNQIFRHNVDAVINLKKAALEKAPQIKRFIFSSSQAAAGPSDCLENPKSESDQCRPISDYGQSKLEAEIRLRESSDLLPLTIIRPPTVYGPRDTDVYLYFKWIDRGIALLPGLRRRYAHLIYVDDLVNGLILAAESENAVGKTYFLSDPRSYSWQEISAAIAKSLSRRPIPIRIPLGLAHFSALLAEAGAYVVKKPGIFNRQKVREMSQLYWTCSPRQAAADFGFECKYDLEKGMSETARWYRENVWLK